MRLGPNSLSGAERITALGPAWLTFPFAPWALHLALGNLIVIVLLLVAARTAKRRGDEACRRRYRTLAAEAALLTVGGNLLWLAAYLVPGSVLASDPGLLFTLASLSPALAWLFPLTIPLDRLRRRIGRF